MTGRATDRRPGSRVGATLMALALGVLALLPAAPSTAAASITFGTPQASSTYNQSIDFSVDMTSSAPVQRVELWLRFPETIGPYIVAVDDPGGSGTRTLHYSMDLTGSGHLVPNTRFTATWAAYPSAGAQPVTSGTETVNYQDTTEQWQTVKGDIMTVHWYQGSQAFANRALAIGEQAIKSTSQLLGVTETQPVDFFIYADSAAFRDALGPGTRENVGGQAHTDIRTLFALITPSDINAAWVGVVIPHELVHLVFDTAVNNPYRFPPRWVNEGLAVYLSEGDTPSDQSLVSSAIASGDLMPLDALTGQFPTEVNLTSLAYAESVSAIDYLVRTYHRSALVALVKAYKDGVTDDEAFTRALGIDVATFQANWLADLGAPTPQRYGPVPAPPGPVPNGWTTPGASPGAPGSTPAAPASPGATGEATVPLGGASASPAAASPGEGAPGAVAGSGSSTAVVVVLLVLLVASVAGLGLALSRRGSPGP